MSETQSETTEAAPDITDTITLDTLSELLEAEFKPRTDDAGLAVTRAVNTLAAQLVTSEMVAESDVIKTIEALVAEIDSKISEQMNEILHHDDFQQLEGAWRGFAHLVNNTETDEMLKIRVLNISKKDLHKTLKKFKGTAWDQSPIFKKLYEEEYGQFGGEPYGALIGATTSITRPSTSNCWAKSRRFPPPHTPHSSPRLRPL